VSYTVKAIYRDGDVRVGLEGIHGIIEPVLAHGQGRNGQESEELGVHLFDMSRIGAYVMYR
jgi:hypothetical protein